MQYKSKIAGILMIVSGAIGFIFIGLLLLQLMVFRTGFGLPNGQNFPPPEFIALATLFNVAYSIGIALLGMFAIIAGMLTIKKKSWGLALAGAIVSSIIFSPCGIPAILLVAFGQDEFSQQKPPSAV